MDGWMANFRFRRKKIGSKTGSISLSSAPRLRGAFVWLALSRISSSWKERRKNSILGVSFKVDSTGKLKVRGLSAN